MAARGKIVGGLLVLVVTALLGLLAKTSSVTGADTRLDEHLVSLRTPVLTTIAKLATLVAQAEVGAAIAVVVPVILWFAKRRRDALLTVSLIIGALAFVFAVKTLVAEPRPPRRLWVIQPDSVMSFPSGHATVAAAVAILLVLLAGGRLRWVAALAGAAFVCLVGFARLYLGLHYLADVIGGCLTSVGVGLLVIGVMDLPGIRRRLEDVGTPATGRHHAGRFGRVPTGSRR